MPFEKETARRLLDDPMGEVGPEELKGGRAGGFWLVGAFWSICKVVGLLCSQKGRCNTNRSVKFLKNASREDF